MSRPDSQPEMRPAEFEPDDIQLGRIGRMALVVPAGIAVALLLAYAFAHWWGADAVNNSEYAPQPVQRPALPALQSAPQPDLAQYRAQKEQQIHALAWTDRQAGLARIPIEDAMRLLVERRGARAGGHASSGAEQAVRR